jgi:hypothetical protein
LAIQAGAAARRSKVLLSRYTTLFPRLVAISPIWAVAILLGENGSYVDITRLPSLPCDNARSKTHGMMRNAHQYVESTATLAMKFLLNVN